MRSRQKTSSFALAVQKGRGKSAVSPEIAEMIYEILRKAGIERGRFVYQIRGSYKTTKGEVAAPYAVLSPMKNKLFRLIIGYQQGRNGAVSGIFRYPRNERFETLQERLETAITSLNASKWGGRLAAIVPAVASSANAAGISPKDAKRGLMKDYTPRKAISAATRSKENPWLRLCEKANVLRREFVGQKVLIDKALHDLDAIIVMLSGHLSKVEQIELFKK